MASAVEVCRRRRGRWTERPELELEVLVSLDGVYVIVGAIWTFLEIFPSPTKFLRHDSPDWSLFGNYKIRGFDGNTLLNIEDYIVG